MERLNKEYEIEVNDNFVMKYGSINRLSPVVLYINGKTWLTPMTDFDYSASINRITTCFKSDLKEQLSCSPYFYDKIISEFDINAKTIKKGKKKFFSFEFYVKQKGDVLKLTELKSPLINTIKKAVDNMAENLTKKTFILSKEKK